MFFFHFSYKISLNFITRKSVLYSEGIWIVNVYNNM